MAVHETARMVLQLICQTVTRVKWCLVKSDVWDTCYLCNVGSNVSPGLLY